jgi:hypothetical protein
VKEANHQVTVNPSSSPSVATADTLTIRREVNHRQRVTDWHQANEAVPVSTSRLIIGAPQNAATRTVVTVRYPRYGVIILYIPHNWSCNWWQTAVSVDAHACLRREVTPRAIPPCTASTASTSTMIPVSAAVARIAARICRKAMPITTPPGGAARRAGQTGPRR